MRQQWEEDKMRRRLFKRDEMKRKLLKSRSVDMRLSSDKRTVALKKLREMNRNQSKTRLRNRCAQTGNPRTIVGEYHLARGRFRELARAGKLPVVKLE